MQERCHDRRNTPRTLALALGACTGLLSATLAWSQAAAPAPAASQPAAKPAGPAAGKKASSADILAASKPADWRAADPELTLQMELPGGKVIIELASAFAPVHAANIVKLTRAGYFDGLAIIRSQENYVTQWGDAEEEDARARKKPDTLTKAPAEFDRPLKGLKVTALPERDTWAARVGFVDGWPVAVDPKTGRAWLPHCNGIVGAARGNAPDSSDGSGLYAIIGHAPRALDLNITTVGRVLQGMDKLSSLPRGTGALGFYEKAEERTPITRVRVLADIPEAERPRLQVLRTDTATWQAWLNSRRFRGGGWFVHEPSKVELCGALPPVRTAP
ncbi:peptidylprolyl isomerase [Mitsuaria sp. WAJ17]|uniref:peptidylprolyl isomerase n=1 Tax=Mitsuaria sp. WAJ17 TaxID=2761452 RepID=UPI0015FF5003|nr:peptidylprolyl isomerase [Mitsuaria sp. WAJ17]MBB2485609.1 peptidylprolyl isomerase [Mitsuaria sp. WAJ17]